MAKGSTAVVKYITSRLLDPETDLSTMNAASMDTNIHFSHVLPRITHFFSETEKGIFIAQLSGLRLQQLVYALELVMYSSIFQFGDMAYLQKKGTAMGTPPVPNYATVSYGIHKFEMIKKFLELDNYARKIEDGFGAWKRLSTPEENKECFKNSKKKSVNIE